MDFKKYRYKTDDFKIDYDLLCDTKHKPIEIVNISINWIVKASDNDKERLREVEDELYRHFKKDFHSPYFRNRRIVVCGEHDYKVMAKNANRNISVELCLKLNEPRLFDDMAEIYDYFNSYVEEYSEKNVMQSFQSVLTEYGEKRKKKRMS